MPFFPKSSLIYAIAYDFAGNSAKDGLSGTSPPFPVFFIFKHLTFPNNYEGYIGRFIIRISCKVWKRMIKKILVGSIIAVAIIILASFSSVVGKVSSDDELVEFDIEYVGYVECVKNLQKDSEFLFSYDQYAFAK